MINSDIQILVLIFFWLIFMFCLCRGEGRCGVPGLELVLKLPGTQGHVGFPVLGSCLRKRKKTFLLKQDFFNENVQK